MEHDRFDRLLALGYLPAAVDRLRELAEGRFVDVQDIDRVLARFPYEDECNEGVCVRSAQSSMLHPELMSINAAILAYALLDCFPEVREKLLLIHRCDAGGAEHGHIVTLYWTRDGMIGALGKSKCGELAGRPPVYRSETEVAASYARSYLTLGYVPRYFGLLKLEQAASDLDWRLNAVPLDRLLTRLIVCHGLTAVRSHGIH